VGSVGAPADDWSSVIIRSDVGKELFDDAVSAGKITVDDKIEMKRIERESLRKKSQIKEIDEKLVSAMKILNITDLEIKTYATIISLGFADLSMLSNAMKVEDVEIKKALNTLKQRKWILETEDFYKAINPNHIITEEIYKLKKSFEENINKIKSEALANLNTLFLKNNLKHILYKEFKELIF